MALLKPGMLMEIISSGTQSVVFGLIVMSVQFETVSPLEIVIVLKLYEDPQFRFDQHRPP